MGYRTAAEIIFQRANAATPFMGLTAFKGQKPTKSEITVAKNYLKEEELAILNRLVSAYLDIAEVNAMQQKAMTMKDWIGILDGLLLTISATPVPPLIWLFPGYRVVHR